MTSYWELMCVRESISDARGADEKGFDVLLSRD